MAWVTARDSEAEICNMAVELGMTSDKILDAFKQLNRRSLRECLKQNEIDLAIGRRRGANYERRKKQKGSSRKQRQHQYELAADADKEDFPT